MVETKFVIFPLLQIVKVLKTLMIDSDQNNFLGDVFGS